MKILKTLDKSPNERYVDIAVEALKDGEIIIYPTDTIYAMGCDALNNQAIEKICRIKGINSDKTNLSIICHDISQVAEYAKFDNDDFKIMRANFPGAFTFIFKALSKLPRAFKGRKTVGVRIPNNDVALMIVEKLGHPLLTSSIDCSDEDFGCEPELMATKYGEDVSVIIDTGRGNTVPSTIIDCTGEEREIIRQGKGVLDL